MCKKHFTIFVPAVDWDDAEGLPKSSKECGPVKGRLVKAYPPVKPTEDTDFQVVKTYSARRRARTMGEIIERASKFAPG